MFVHIVPAIIYIVFLCTPFRAKVVNKKFPVFQAIFLHFLDWLSLSSFSFALSFRVSWHVPFLRIQHRDLSEWTKRSPALWPHMTDKTVHQILQYQVVTRLVWATCYLWACLHALFCSTEQKCFREFPFNLFTWSLVLWVGGVHFFFY